MYKTVFYGTSLNGGKSGMTKADRQITALEFAIQYVPGSDENHSHSVLLDMLAELRSRKEERRLTE
jgi:hypothetical protein